MFKKLFAFAIACVCVQQINAQTTIIYYNGLSGSQCNVFGTTVNYQGLNHTTTYGQPVVGDYALKLSAKKWGVDDLRSGYKIQYNFVAGDSYTIEVMARSTVANKVVTLRVYTGNTTASSNGCAGPAAKQTSGLNQVGQYDISLDQYAPLIVQNFLAPSNMNSLVIDASGFNTVNELVYLEILQVTIYHTAAAPPAVFTVSSSVASLTCGADIGFPLTFTVNNVNNTPGVNKYDYIVTPYQWADALGQMVSTTITSTSNSIQLKPYQCGSGNFITVIPYVNNLPQPAVTKTIPVTGIPTFSISGLSELPSQAGLYYFTGSPLCGAANPIWSIDNTTLAQLNINSSTQVGIQKKTGLGVPTSGTVILKATLPQCGVLTTTTKSIFISSPFGRPAAEANEAIASIAENADGVKVYPNPTKGKITIGFAQDVASNKIIISDVTGKQILIQNATGITQEIDLSKCPSGIYFLKIIDGLSTKLTKIIKN